MVGGLGERLTAATPILVLGAGLLALFTGVDNWWVIFVIGWAVVTPLVAILTGDETPPGAGPEWMTSQGADESATDEEPEPSRADALETLRDRYARGELTETQFERKVERLLETETLEDARAHVGGGEPGSPAGEAASNDADERSGGEPERESGRDV